MGLPERLRRLDERVLGPARSRYPRGYALTVPDAEFVSQWDAAAQLGISVGRVDWRVACEHLEPAEDAARTMGVTRASLEREVEWQRRATRWSKVRRVIGNTLRWI